MSQISPQKPPITSQPRAKTNVLQQHAPWLYAFWKFSRPHTVVGTTLSVLGLYCIALSRVGVLSSAEGFNALLTAGQAAIMDAVLPTLLACLCGNVYIVGLNQLEDVAIDRVNKPHLPLASGEFSRREAQVIVVLTGIVAIALAVLQGHFLLATIGISLAIGTAYSLPPIRLKRFPVWASFCIFTVRGVVVNVGLFLHFNDRLQQNTAIPITVWVLTAFILVFTLAIALFKDIPDMEGDRRYNITTFTIRLGQRAVFNLCRWILTSCYVGIMMAARWMPQVNTALLIGVHSVILALFWWYSLRVDLQDKAQIARFYQFIWKLFFLEYLLFPIACLLG
ncbi:homogentisate phytyltransferase [Oscillatoria sp. FACHB-1407]|uniref:homogentisate phytyltransferase n=1 Tax=Oscillatoria sp. FACHB-1407 TaxID=2692847 RepID=UPI0016846872|nr:homogentisate phytyltransferase [Oscillatoria sp. FACHB-1407]MBD2462940.1 homogentisate phytyltransferase [Oscillatoria sp. FACHB-1407]